MSSLLRWMPDVISKLKLKLIQDNMLGMAGSSAIDNDDKMK